MEDQPEEQEGRKTPAESAGAAETGAEAAHSAIAEAQALSRLWSYALTVLYPAAALKQAGLYRAEHLGARPSIPERNGLGRHFSRRYPFPVVQEGLAGGEGSGQRRLERLLEPLRELLLKEMLREAQPYLRPDFRALDPACGVGAEAIELAMLLGEGEAAAVFADPDMMGTAFDQAREQGVSNLAFFQAGPESLPPEFSGAFDLVFSLRSLWLAQSRPAALYDSFRALRRDGVVVLADLAPPGFVFDNLSEEKRPEGWSPLESGKDLLGQMELIGFAQGYWEELLPGIGLILGVK